MGIAVNRIVRTVCQGCHCECGVLVNVENGIVTKVGGDPGHPMNRGFVCVKGEAYPQLVHHPDRLKFPLRRAGERGEGKWKRVSWDEALDSVARKLTEIKEEYGTESIASIHGTGPRMSLFSTRLLAYALNSPNVISVDLHICYAPSLIAEFYTIGNSIMMEVGPDYKSANCILVWGGNPLASHPPRGIEIIEAKSKRNVKLVVVDPRRTLLASKADLWLQIRPGTDAALALGMMNVIIDHELYDRKFVDEWCYGFDKLEERVKEYPPEKIAEITWVPVDKIKEAAMVYAKTKPATLHHRVAIEHNINSVQTCRALVTLIALTGNIDVEGGNLLPMPPPEGYIHSASLLGGNREFRPDYEVEEKGIGSRKFPLASGSEAIFPFVPSPLFLETLTSGKPYPIKALYCAGGNPVVNMQSSKSVWEALKNLELFVVTDFFMTPTAELADIVLPAATWVERDECCDTSYPNYISARQRVINPLFECWDDMKIVLELVKKMPWANRKFLPWNDVNEYNEWRVEGMGITFEDLRRKTCIMKSMKYRKYEEKGFNTPSGKVELYSTIFEKYGYDPLPHYVEPPESPVSTPQLLKDYPLILITGGRHIEYFHSEGRQIPRLRKLVPDPEVEIHPDTAKEANIEHGDWVWIETPRVKVNELSSRLNLLPIFIQELSTQAHAWWFPEKPAHNMVALTLTLMLYCRAIPLER